MGNRPSKWKVTRHACERWVERVGDTRCTWGARSTIQRAMLDALLIPGRLGGLRWNRKHLSQSDSRFRARGTRYYFHPKARLTIASTTVVTISAADDDDLATVLVWKMMGFWVEKRV